MKGPLINRFKELKAIKENNPESLTVSEEYELGMLASFHEPNGDPHYDDLWDNINLVTAITNISKLASDELHNTMVYIDSINISRSLEDGE